MVSLVAYSNTHKRRTALLPKENLPTDSNSVDHTIGVWISVYHGLKLDSLGLSTEAFEQAMKGWEKLKKKGSLSNETILTIADFSQPSTSKRLYVLDVEKNQLLFHTYVAHGRNSGKEQAVSYSNRAKSHMSSPGFYRTESTYYGNNGYSLKLAGLEKGINDNALRRAIVIHGADYVSESLIESQGYLGRSYGCPAIPTYLTRPIINTIKNGTCLFIHAPITYYAQRSSLIR
ncbi:MAG: hypothetical protein A1D16_07850 [Flavihumibacter sp. CACIAM 22H1]|nr:MAG: hypothetical protein A1D16_07850 [Flavihumibacter sp. CACIAM 22H1]